MANVDSDRVFVVRATRDGSTNIVVEVDWTDRLGGPKGRFLMSWATAEEFRAFLDSQDETDIIRAVMLQCIDRDTGALKPAVFSGLPGKTFEIQQRVRQV